MTREDSQPLPNGDDPDPELLDDSEPSRRFRDTLDVSPEVFRRSNLWMAGLFYGVILLGAGVGGPWLGSEPLRWLPTGEGTLSSIPGSLLLGLGAGLVIVLVGQLLTPYFKFLRTMQKSFAELLFWIRGWVDIAWLAATSAIAEEALFRGALQPSIGIVWTSLLFAVCHPPLIRSLIAWPIFAFLISLLLGALFQTGGDALMAPIACHFAINFFNLGILTAASRRDGLGPNDLPPSQQKRSDS